MTILTAATPSTATDPASVAATVKHVAGMLWYEMLSALDSTAGDSSSLGTGATDFQSLFNWNIAQGDFGKYDSQLASAATAQLSHQAASPEPLSSTLSGVLGTPVPSMLGALTSFPVPADLTDSAALTPSAAGLRSDRGAPPRTRARARRAR